MKISRLVVSAGFSLFIPATLIAAPALATQSSVAVARVKSTTPSGPALVHLEASMASVSAKAANSHVSTLTLNFPKKVHWFGEVKNAQGQDVLTHGEQPASQLPDDWKPLGHSQNLGAMATLTWNTHTTNPRYALVQMEKPAYNSHKQAIQARFTSQDAIPAHIADVSLNLHRAPAKSNRGFPTTSIFNFSATTFAQTVQMNAATVQEAIINGATICYQGVLIPQAPVATMPDGLTCGAVKTFINGTFSMNIPTSSRTGQAIFNGTLMSNGGQPFQYYGVIASLQYS